MLGTVAVNRRNFDLIRDVRGGGWFDVKYPGEAKARYMIDGKKHSCTCMGNTNGLECKHLKKLDEYYCKECQKGLICECGKYHPGTVGMKPAASMQPDGKILAHRDICKCEDIIVIKL